MTGKAEQIHLGGFDVEFVTKPEIDVRCAICLMTLKDPVQTIPCYHQFCKDCIIHHKSRYAGTLFRCPLCNNEVNMWYPDKGMERTVLNLLIKCPNYKDGCVDTFILNSLEDHVSTCVYVDIKCTNVNCEMKVQRRYLNEHLPKCENRILQCKHCNGDYVFKNKQFHEEACKRLPLQCTNKCDKVLPREEMAKHLEDGCPNTIHDCTYIGIIGCPVKGTRAELSEHLDNDTKQHLALAIGEIKDLKHNKDIVSQKLDFLYNLAVKKTCNHTSLRVENFTTKAEMVDKTDKAQSFDSDHFTFLNGYQAKLRVIIKPKYCVGIYFILVKGPYDDILKWPFEGTIKFSCKGKDGVPPKTRELATVKETHETIEKCFKQPISLNAGYGFILFTSSEVQSEEFQNYIINNALSIDVSVSKTVSTVL